MNALGSLLGRVEQGIKDVGRAAVAVNPFAPQTALSPSSLPKQTPQEPGGPQFSVNGKPVLPGWALGSNYHFYQIPQNMPYMSRLPDYTTQLNSPLPSHPFAVPADSPLPNQGAWLTQGVQIPTNYTPATPQRFSI